MTPLSAKCGFCRSPPPQKESLLLTAITIAFTLPQSQTLCKLMLHTIFRSWQKDSRTKKYSGGNKMNTPPSTPVLHTMPPAAMHHSVSRKVLQPTSSSALVKRALYVSDKLPVSKMHSSAPASFSRFSLLSRCVVTATRHQIILNKLSALCNNEICSETSVLEHVGESFKDGLKI